MKKDISFYHCEELDAALKLLAEDNNLKPIAGGTDLMVEMRNDENFQENISGLLDITALEELQGITVKENHINIGALVTHQEIVNSEVLQEKYSALVAAAAAIGSTQIRNRGTIGGNVCNAAACADTLGPLIAFEADALLESYAGERVVPAADLVTRPYQTVIRDDELLKCFRLPLPAADTFSNFQKIGRRQALAITRISLALVAQIADGMVKQVKVVPGSTTPVPEPFAGVEARIRDRKIADLKPAEIAAAASEEMVSITGERWSTPYKKPALETLVTRALVQLKEVADNE